MKLFYAIIVIVTISIFIIILINNQSESVYSELKRHELIGSYGIDYKRTYFASYEKTKYEYKDLILTLNYDGTFALSHSVPFIKVTNGFWVQSTYKEASWNELYENNKAMVDNMPFGQFNDIDTQENEIFFY